MCRRIHNYPHHPDRDGTMFAYIDNLGKKLEELCPTSHNIVVPIIKREDYTFIIIDAEDENHHQIKIKRMSYKNGKDKKIRLEMLKYI